MEKVFKDVIEIKITLDTVDMKSICDAVAEVHPHMEKEDFFDIALKEIIRSYFCGYTWYQDNMFIYEMEELCPNIVEKMAEYIDWYIIHYYLIDQEDFKWSD